MASTSPEPNEIRVQARAIGVLFNSLDPSPFRERDIDAEVERHIVEWAREMPRDAEPRIVVELPADEATKPEAATLPEAISNYFSDRARSTEAELRELFRIGWRSLQIGIVVLVAALTAQQAKAEGLFVDVVPRAKLIPAALEIARQIMAATPRRAAAGTKMAVMRGEDTDFESCLSYEAYLQSYLFQTEDHKQRLRTLLTSLKK